MAVQYDPIAKDESLNTTELSPRNVADVLAQELAGIASAITGGADKVPKTDIATVEPTNTASRAYSVGELVYVNGNLYKVITAISIGSTFTVGTNIQSTNVSNKIKEVNGLIKYDTVSGTTDQNGNLTTSVPLNKRFILSAQFTMAGANGVAIPASYIAGNIWYFRCLDGLSQPMASTAATVKYAYVDI